MNDAAQAEDIHAKNREGVAGQVAQMPTRPPKIPFTLREMYDRYKDNKGIGRQDLFGCMVEEIEKLKARIGSVDEAAVAALDKRLSSLETVIGNALRPHSYGIDSDVEAPRTGVIAPEPKRKPGRPSNAEIAAREASNG